jgi:hypothetical protein
MPITGLAHAVGSGGCWSRCGAQDLHGGATAASFAQTAVASRLLGSTADADTLV